MDNFSNPYVLLALSIVGIFVVLILYDQLSERSLPFRFAKKVKGRSAPYKTDPKTEFQEWLQRELEDYQESCLQQYQPSEPTLEQRVAALEESTTDLALDSRILATLRRWRPEAATPSPATASPTTDSPSDAAEPEFIPRLSPASWQSDRPTTEDGLAVQDSDSADPPVASI